MAGSSFASVTGMAATYPEVPEGARADARREVRRRARRAGYLGFFFAGPGGGGGAGKCACTAVRTIPHALSK